MNATKGSGEESAPRDASESSSAALISFCVMLSRVTGFVRTWAMAFALGSSFLSSSYQVANNLPSILYEMVMGGMLVTAFLPVYVSVKKQQGARRATSYASTLFTLVVIVLGAVSVLGIIFPQAIIYTQSFYSDQDTMGYAVFFFQFFAIQTVFYGCSSIVSGLLNADRDYLWSSIAPVANNIIVIATFFLYAALVNVSQELALYVIAIGNPLGVAVQMLIQMPALKRNGIRLRWSLKLRDPALRETLAIGVPAIIAMVFSFATVSVMNAAAYSFLDSGPSILVYARLWYTLPYSFIAIPISTQLFTEISHMFAEHDREGFGRAIASGTSQILFLLIPFMLFLMVFSYPLVTIYHVGTFDMENVSQISAYLCVLALALPFYGLSTFMQKVFSAMRRMGSYAVISGTASMVQIALTMLAVAGMQAGLPITIESIALVSALFYLLVDIASLAFLRWKMGRIGIGRILKATALGVVLGGIGALAGAAVLFGLNLLAPLDGSVPQAFIYIIAGGAVALFFAFAPACKMQLPEAALVRTMVDKSIGRLRRK